MKYIQDLHEGDRISEVYIVKSKTSGTSKTGKTFYSLKLQDKTGTLDAKVWDLNNNIEHFENNDFVLLEGEITVFQNTNQLKVTKARRARIGEYDPANYMPVSPFPIETMFENLIKLAQKVEHPKLRALISSFFIEDKAFIDEFKAHSAGKSVHHNFIGGLLQHTLNVMNICYFYCKQYPTLNKDLLLTAALFHDVGKVKELSHFPENDYTDEGQLLGHIVIGYQMLNTRIDEIGGFPEKLKTELLHCILAHHGELEFGSPKKPSLLEAMALSYADNTDAKMEIMIEEFEAATTNDFLGVNRFLGTNIRKTSKE